jgi:hypothetical protein
MALFGAPLAHEDHALRACLAAGRARRRDGRAGARAKIGARLRGLDAGLAEHLPLLCDFLGVADPERPLPSSTPRR